MNTTFTKSTRQTGTNDHTTASYRVAVDGVHVGYVTGSTTSTTATAWTAYGRFGTRPVASGFTTRAAAAKALA